MANKESMEVIAFLQGLALAMDKADDDGKIDWADSPLAPKLGMLAGQAVVGSTGIIEEIKGMNGEEQQELLHATIAAILDLFMATSKLIAATGSK